MNKKTLILLFLFVLLCVACPVIIIADNRNVHFNLKDKDTVEIEISTGTFSGNIMPYYSAQDDTYYYFLPSFVSTDKIYAYPFSDGPLINGKAVDAMEGFSWDDENTYDMDIFGNTVRVRFMRTSDIPSLFISIDPVSLDKIIADKTHTEKGRMTVVDPDGRIEYSGGLFLKGRGNFTFDYFYKKPFHITLNDTARLLGMRENKDWCLLANSCDPAFMNNKFALDMSSSIGSGFVPGAEYADLYINGDYQGLYLITEKIKVGKNNIDIRDLDKDNQRSSPNEPADITGGYLLERDYRVPSEKQPPSYFITEDNKTPVRIRSPKYATKNETAYISSLVNEMEGALMSPDGYSDTGKYYLDYIDLGSWVWYYIMAEMAHDEDLGLTSTFLYKDTDDADPLFYMGPCWDLDQAYGADQNHASPEVLYRCPGSWFEYLYEKKEFHDEVCRVWSESFAPYLEDQAEKNIRYQRERIRSSAAMDNIRWYRSDGYDGLIAWPKEGGGYSFDYSFDTQADLFEDWIRRRYVFLNGLWMDAGK